MVDRKELVDQLGSILQPKRSHNYFVIVGKEGSGKTTVVKQALSTLKSPKGVVYVDCPVTANQFSVSLARLIGILGDQLGANPNDEPLETFLILLQPMLDAAAKFKTKHGRPMVLVIDSVDIMAKQHPAFLELLQDFAKFCVDAGHLRVVFISSNGLALPEMMARSTWSRAYEPLYEIEELADDEAIDHLMKKGVPVDIAKLAVANLTGGSFALLNQFASAYLHGMSYEQMLQQKDEILCEALLKLNVVPLNHDLFQRLVKNQSVTWPEALELGLEKAQVLLQSFSWRTIFWPCIRTIPTPFTTATRRCGLADKG